MSCEPALGDGKAFVGGQGDDNFYCVDLNTGAQLWSKPGVHNSYTHPATYLDGIVYLNSYGLGLVALDGRNGNTIWDYFPGNYMQQIAPAVGGGRVYGVYSANDTVFAVAQSSGVPLWETPGVANDFAWPIYDSERLFVSNRANNTVTALRASDGSVLWQHSLPPGAEVGSTGYLSFWENRLYVAMWDDGNGQGALRALDADTGSELWTFRDTAEGIRPAVIANDILYTAGYYSKTIYALDPRKGEPLDWSYDLPDRPIGLSVAEGMLFVACSRAGVLAFRSSFSVPEGCEAAANTATGTGLAVGWWGPVMLVVFGVGVRRRLRARRC